MTPPVRIGRLELERSLTGNVTIHDGIGGRIDVTVDEARRLKDVGLPAILPARTVAEAAHQARSADGPQTPF